MGAERARKIGTIACASFARDEIVAFNFESIIPQPDSYIEIYDSYGMRARKYGTPGDQKSYEDRDILEQWSGY